MTARGSLEEFLQDIAPFFYGKSLTYVDVGAYVGKVFKKVSASSLRIREAHLVEPNPASLPALRDAAAERRSQTCTVHVHDVALGAASGVSRLRAAESMTKVIAVGPEDPVPAGLDNLFDASCKTLDELAVGITEGHISLLKIDVEGGEQQVLSGASKLLAEQRVDVIYIEVGMNPEGTQQCYYRLVDDELRDKGYRLFKVYEQVHEWLDDSPLLRRANLAYLSQRFADNHPYRLCRELFDARHQQQTLQAELATDKARIASLEAELARAAAEHRNTTEALTEERQRAQQATQRLDLRDAELRDAAEKARRGAEAASRLEQEVRASAAATSALELQLRLLGKERDELDARLAVVVGEHQRDMTESARSAARVEALIGQCEELRYERARAIAERDAASLQYSLAQKQIDDLSAGQRNLTERLEQESVRAREATARHDDALRQLAAASVEAEQANVAIAHAIGERDAAVARCAELASAAEHVQAATSRTEHSSEAASLQASLAEANARHEALQHQYDTLRASYAETEQMAREVHRLYDNLRNRERRARAEAALAVDKIARIKQHLSYRLGAALIEGSRSPLGWLRTPAALKQAYSDFQKQKEIGRAPAQEPPNELLRLGGSGVVLPLSSDWQHVTISVQQGTEVCAHALAVVAEAFATLELSVVRRTGDVHPIELAGEPLSAGSVSTSATATHGLRLRAGRQQVLLRSGGEGDLELKLRKTRGEPCILRLELRPSGLPLRATSLPEALVRVESVPVGLSGEALAALLVKHGSRKSGANVLFEAFKRLRDGQGEAALDFAEAHADPLERPGIHLLKAVLHESDETAWLRHFNEYLRPSGIAPIELAATGSNRFHRLRAPTLRQVEAGPLISVIMPAFNAQQTLGFAAASILNQTWRNVQLIIVDDASSDGTWPLARSLAAADRRVVAVRNAANVGPYVSKNIGLRAAKGEYVTGHDADDWAHPERLEAHLLAVRATGGHVRASLAGMLRMTADGRLTRFAPRGPNTNDGALAAGFISCLFEARFLKEILGGWDEVRFGGDSEIIQRAERVIGAPLPRFAHLGMICLDSPDGLTNHPEFGYSPLLGMSVPRRAYRDSFKQWHDKLTAADAWLPFPQLVRRFQVPNAMAVNPRELAATLEGHTTAGGSRVLRSPDVCDVCIITDLRLPGGNASSTLEEIRHLRAAGARVLVVHCPTARTQGKPISSRYDEFAEICEYFYNVSAIDTDVLIVRHPAVAASAKFGALAPRIRARAVAAIVNNSMKRADGEYVYAPELLRSNVAAVQSQKSRIFPLGPAIRRELQALGGTFELADYDWTPTFDSAALDFKPKRTMAAPFVIGRHARDGVEKWPEERAKLLSIYPEHSDFKISILGGADAALATLGYTPRNWEILPFGSTEPAAYLATLDAFVYFPHTGLNEAFGRAIMEAIFAGVPCILPRAFRATFDDMVFYSEPEDVAGVVRRLSRHPEWRLDFLKHARDRAYRYESAVLSKRLADLRGTTHDGGEQPAAPAASLTGTVREYKAWVETGQWVTPKESAFDSGH